ncbi:heme exporter protein CcmD [Telmatospirillum siberiense]|uniref:Heme exporter protein D n=2 Tax=Telmatospirillum siberiense TaxID=382514 RepID=A0A2N3PVS9_9PROT|nr:heme exporter protein CcmD [Telmatospirillum siberiense]
MDSIATFFEMGGYARFVWPAYGLVGLVTVGLLVTSLRTLRVRERALAALQEEMPGRRGRSRDL